MKLLLLGNGPERAIRILGGGYDAKAGRAVLIVEDDEGHPGMMTFDVGEARNAIDSLSRDLPTVERVEKTINAPNISGTVLPVRPLTEPK